MPHIHELYDFTVTVFIVYKDSVLLVNHPRYQKWIPIGGHIELDENPEQALYREIAEETGLTVTLLTNKPSVTSAGTLFMPTPNYLDIHEANPPHQHISLTYFAKSDSDSILLSDEHTAAQWFKRSDLDDETYQLSEAVRFYCNAALDAAY